MKNDTAFIRLMHKAGLLLLVVCCSACSGKAPDAPRTPAAPPTETSAEADLRERLEDARLRFGLPAVAGGYVTADGRIVCAVTGFRRAGSDAAVTRTDLFHLGSVTKPITATLAATGVDAGWITWETRVGDLLAARLPDMHDAHRATTLDQLLRHRAGLAAFEEDEEWQDVPSFDGTASEKRARFVEWLLSRPPELPVGREHRYSNAGYSVAALMLEEASGETWERLLESRLLDPLSIEHHAFGWPIESGRPGTWGHRPDGDGLRPHDPDSDGYRFEDFYIGPAGDLSLDIDGLARFARMHLLGLQGHDTLLPSSLIQAMHTPLPGDDYALGWNTFPTRSTHLGSGGTAFASIYLMRERRLGLVVATNAWSEAETEFGAALLGATLDAARAAGVTPE